MQWDDKTMKNIWHVAEQSFVIDANILISAIVFKSFKPVQAIKVLTEGTFLLSSSVVEEQATTYLYFVFSRVHLPFLLIDIITGKSVCIKVKIHFSCLTLIYFDLLKKFQFMHRPVNIGVKWS
jgi:predicted nucleic acid-binding protein